MKEREMNTHLINLHKIIYFPELSVADSNVACH